MDKVKIGLPRAFTYYYFSDLWKIFFKELNIDYIESPPTNKEIISKGMSRANDEMCLSFKIYLGHIDYLKDKCDYILVPRIDNYGKSNQTCTNFLAAFDIINNLFETKILDYNINLEGNNNELDGFLRIGKLLNKSRYDVIKAYNKAILDTYKIKQNKIKKNIKALENDGLKVLLVSHSYNTYDAYIGKQITDYLEEMGVTIIYSDMFDDKETNKLAYKLSDTIYFKYSKDNIGSIKLVQEKVDGIIFLSAFPCGLDSLVNELVMRKINKPYLNLIMDESYSLTGIKTRIESFVDILEQRRQKN